LNIHGEQVSDRRRLYDARFCFLNFAQRAFCASEIRFRAAAERRRRPPRRADRPLFPTVKPCNALTAASRPRNSSCTSARLVCMSSRIWARFTVVSSWSRWTAQALNCSKRLKSGCPISCFVAGSSSRHDSIFQLQKLLQAQGQSRRKLLPG
jgi:hypothetical protein